MKLRDLIFGVKQVKEEKKEKPISKDELMRNLLKLTNKRGKIAIYSVGNLVVGKLKIPSFDILTLATTKGQKASKIIYTLKAYLNDESHTQGNTYPVSKQGLSDYALGKKAKGSGRPEITFTKSDVKPATDILWKWLQDQGEVE